MYEFGLITTFSKTPGVAMDYQEFKTALIEKYPNADYCEILDKIVIEYDSKKIKFTGGSKGKFKYDQKMCKSGAASRDKNVGDIKAKTSDKYNDLAIDKGTKQNLSGENKATTGDKYKDFAIDKDTKQNLRGDNKARTSDRYDSLSMDKDTKAQLKGENQAKINSKYNDISVADKANLGGDTQAKTSSKYNEPSIADKTNLKGDTQAKTNTKYNDAQLDAEMKKNLKNNSQEELDYDYYKYQKVGDPGYKKRKDYDLDKFNASSQRYIQEESKKDKKKREKEEKKANAQKQEISDKATTKKSKKDKS